MDRNAAESSNRLSLRVMEGKTPVPSTEPARPLPPPADASWPVSFPADAPSSAPDLSIAPEEGGTGHAAHCNRPRRSDLPAPMAQLEEEVVKALRQIFDPEIPVNIYDLGLIYEIEVSADNSVRVLMTLTAPGCPVAGSLPPEVESRIEHIPDVTKARVELIWDPAWTRDMLSEVARLELGM